MKRSAHKSIPAKNRTASAALALLLVMSILFSVGFIAAEAGHDCSGEDCPVCVCLSLCETVTRLFRSASGILLVLVFALFFPAAVRREDLFPNPGLTPVRLKIQLNN